MEYIYIMSTKGKTFKKIDIANKHAKITIYKINQLVKANVDKLKGYEKLTDISNLKQGDRIKYIQLNVDKKDAEMKHGGVVSEIIAKDNGDYFIKLDGIAHESWNILYSKVVIFKQVKTVVQLRQEQYDKWKQDLKENDPEKYKEWEKKHKERMKKKSIDDEKKENTDKKEISKKKSSKKKLSSKKSSSG